MNLYSQRNRISPTGEFVFFFDETVRNRLFTAIQNHFDSCEPGIELVLRGVGDLLAETYGQLSASSFHGARVSDHPVVEHFFRSQHEQILDFIEAIFYSTPKMKLMRNPNNQLVERINAILQEKHIGYELTEHRMTVLQAEEEKTSRWQKMLSRGGRSVDNQLPRFINRGKEIVYDQAVKPALEVLAMSKFIVANQELLQGLSDYRSQNYESALTSIGSAFESFLKAICKEKNWPFDADKDSHSRLVRICKEHELFPPFYSSHFESIGTIRNKLSDAHGRAHSPNQPAEKDNVEHFINVVASAIHLLNSLAF